MDTENELRIPDKQLIMVWAYLIKCEISQSRSELIQLDMAFLLETKENIMTIICTDKLTSLAMFVNDIKWYLCSKFVNNICI